MKASTIIKVASAVVAVAAAGVAVAAAGVAIYNKTKAEKIHEDPAPSKSTQSNPARSSGIEVDGWWRPNTIEALKRHFGTPVDFNVDGNI